MCTKFYSKTKLARDKSSGQFRFCYTIEFNKLRLIYFCGCVLPRRCHIADNRSNFHIRCTHLYRTKLPIILWNCMKSVCTLISKLAIRMNITEGFEIPIICFRQHIGHWPMFRMDTDYTHPMSDKFMNKFGTHWLYACDRRSFIFHIVLTRAKHRSEYAATK